MKNGIINSVGVHESKKIAADLSAGQDCLEEKDFADKVSDQANRAA